MYDVTEYKERSDKIVLRYHFRVVNEDKEDLGNYHFIKMLDRPVNLPLRFIVVRVTEPLTFSREKHVRTKVNGLIMSQNNSGCHYLPQWQKSDEIMKRLEGSARYLLSSFPYSCSLDSLRAPTSTGTMLNSSLWLQHQIIELTITAPNYTSCHSVIRSEWTEAKNTSHLQWNLMRPFNLLHDKQTMVTHWRLILVLHR